MAHRELTRKPDFRRAHKRLGRQDALFDWKKGYEQSKILSTQEWQDVPEKITVRIIRFYATMVRCLMGEAVALAGVEFELVIRGPYREEKRE